MFIPHPHFGANADEVKLPASFLWTSSQSMPFVRGKWEEGFKFLPVEYGSKFEDYYLPSHLDSTDYPKPGG